MKIFAKFLVLTAALIAIFDNGFADEGGVVVMDRAYYDQCKSSFYHQCWFLDASIVGTRQQIDWDLNQLQNYNRLLLSQSTRIQNEINTAQISVNSINPVDTAQSVAIADAQSYLSSALTSAYELDSMISDNYEAITNLRRSVEVLTDDLRSQVTVVSNLFPVDISATNLNLYVVVSNNFEFLTNMYNSVSNDFSGFLNWYDVERSSVLDQYRATVTNLLDWSNYYYWIDYSYWISGTYITSSQLKYGNWIFSQMNFNPLGVSDVPRVFNSGLLALRDWRVAMQTLPSGASYSDFVAFSIQGIHDSVEYSAKNLKQLYEGLIVPACTNSVFTYPLNATQTNALAQFLSAPDSYNEQVSKLSQTRNWFQRIEHWLSAIARNTYKPDKPEIDDVEDERRDKLQGITNDVSHSVTSLFEGFEDTSKDATNVLAQATAKFTENITAIYNVFSDKGSNTRSGSQSAHQRFSKLNFMESTWIGEYLQDKTKKPNDVPAYITIQDIENGQGANSAWSISSRLLDIVHKVFGVVWCIIGFGLGIWEIIMLTKFFINIWWRLIKFIPGISRYALGS